MKKDSIKIYGDLDNVLLKQSIYEKVYDDNMLYKYLAELVIFDFADEVAEHYLYDTKNNDIQFIIKNELHHIHFNKEEKLITHAILKDDLLLKLEVSNVSPIKISKAIYKNETDEIGISLSSNDDDNIKFVQQMIKK